MRAILPLLSLATVSQALYFFIDGTQPKCFFEDLPKDTLVVGHFEAQEWDDNTQSWSKHDGLNIYISVDVRPNALPYGADNGANADDVRPL
jgi:p24 family protein alpha